jgi:hypothetical protein
MGQNGLQWTVRSAGYSSRTVQYQSYRVDLALIRCGTGYNNPEFESVRATSVSL